MCEFYISEKKKNPKTSACNLLLKCNENVPFLKQILTGDKKWILYSHMEEIMRQTKSTTANTSEASLHPMKVMCVVGGISNESPVMSSFREIK